MGAAVVVLVGVVAWVLASRALGRWSVTAPILMTALGVLYVLVPATPAVLQVTTEPVKQLVEVTLAVILFTDASHIGARWFGDASARVTARLLGIGLPLTMLLGYLVGLVLFPGVPAVLLAVIATSLAPTDAALGASVMADPRIPMRLRQVINVESGLNDGLATPVVLFFLAVAVAENDRESVVAAFSGALVEIAIAVAVGAVIGWLGGRLLVLADRARWSLAEQEPIATLAVALLAYLVGTGLGGNGFVTAFVAGVGFGTAVARHRPPDVMVFADRIGLLLSFVVWFVFGGYLVPAVETWSWQALLYAVLSLTVVRMVPVALSLIGTAAPRDEVLLLGWLGPRGLASIVFALIALDELGVDGGGSLVTTVVTFTVVLSVLAHGLSAGPLATWYATRHPEPATPGSASDS